MQAAMGSCIAPCADSLNSWPLLRCLGYSPVVKAELVQSFASDEIPYHVGVVFDKWDTDKDGKLTMEEWSKAQRSKQK